MTTTAEPARLLRLIALDPDDLSVMSAHLQDTLIPIDSLAYLPKEKRFALVGRRFDWVEAAAGGCQRWQTGLHFESVRAVARAGFEQTETDRVLNLLAIGFEAGEAPGGTIIMTFSGGAAIRLEVECVEAQMRDLGERWRCDTQPSHPVDAGA